MRTALFLLLLLAVAAIPGSLVPQRTADPNGVTQYFDDNPELAPALDRLQAFDVYSSVWFSSIYLLLFISLVGCVIPRTKHHLIALRSRPPRTPARLQRMVGYTTRTLPNGHTAQVDALESARLLLKKNGFRTSVSADSVSAERGYLRETGNLVFHGALVGVLIAMGIGGGFSYRGQKVLVEGQAFANTLGAYDSFEPGRFFEPGSLDPYRLSLGSLAVEYEEDNPSAIGQPIDFTATVAIDARDGRQERTAAIKVNEPAEIGGTTVYLLGNGYAPRVTVRDPTGAVVWSDSVPFLPQDPALTSTGVIKVPDGLSEQVGMIGLFYPTQQTSAAGDFSSNPDLKNPVLSLNVYSGDLGLDDGVPKSVYSLDTDGMTQLSGRNTDVAGIRLTPGETQELPNGLGSVTLESVPRFASFDFTQDPSEGWVLLFTLSAFAGLLTSLFIPRRRMWVKVATVGDALRIEYAGLARGDDPHLEAAVTRLADTHVPFGQEHPRTQVPASSTPDRASR